MLRGEKGSGIWLPGRSRTNVSPSGVRSMTEIGSFARDDEGSTQVVAVAAEGNGIRAVRDGGHDEASTSFQTALRQGSKKSHISWLRDPPNLVVGYSWGSPTISS